MIEKGLILTGSHAELLSRVLSEIKAKAYQEIEERLDDTQAQQTLISRFKSAENDRRKKETR